MPVAVEHLELPAVRVAEGEHRPVLAVDDRRVVDAELGEVSLPLVEVGALGDLQTDVVEPGTPRVEARPVVAVVLLELDPRG
jgi:hypothetical protein